MTKRMMNGRGLTFVNEIKNLRLWKRQRCLGKNESDERKEDGDSNE